MIIINYKLLLLLINYWQIININRKNASRCEQQQQQQEVGFPQRADGITAILVLSNDWWCLGPSYCSLVPRTKVMTITTFFIFFIVVFSIIIVFVVVFVVVFVTFTVTIVVLLVLLLLILLLLSSLLFLLLFLLWLLLLLL